MADLTKQFESQLESIALLPSDGGRFEVMVDNDLIFSKLELGRHAEEGEVSQLVSERG